ncbi:MAG: hypothetical protein IKL09_04980 [Clostridia bacterium]|nr:hypothetical protein [Clostridia bacterium]
MLVYFVKWTADAELCKGKGRIKHSEWIFAFTVLCRSSRDASSCLEYLFKLNYQGKFSLCDGEITIRRQKIDSRGFDVQYLLMDGMKKPLYLSDVSRAIDTYHSSLTQLSVYQRDLIAQL